MWMNEASSCPNSLLGSYWMSHLRLWALHRPFSFSPFQTQGTMTVKSSSNFLGFSPFSDNVLGLDVPFCPLEELPVLGLSILSHFCESPGFTHCHSSPSPSLLWQRTKKCWDFVSLLIWGPFVQLFCCGSLLVLPHQSSSILHSCQSQHFHQNIKQGPQGQYRYSSDCSPTCRTLCPSNVDLESPCPPL